MNTKINHIYTGNFSMAPAIGAILLRKRLEKKKDVD